MYLINLGPCHLLGIVGCWHEDLHDVDQAPEGVLLVQEEQGYGGDPVEPLAVLNSGVVQTIG